MQRKLLAVAVGSALGAIGAPTVSVAQTATVSVFGTFYGEYSYINNGTKSTNSPSDSYRSYDHWQNPGSELGFRGEEKLGGNLSIWFQCTSSMDYRGSGSQTSSNSQAGSTLCTRNSAIGAKGPIGNLFYGNWHTPFARVSAMNNTGSNDTGVFGNAHIMAGTSTTTGISSSTSPTNNLDPGTFRRRQNSLITYETPVFSGFQAMGAYTAANFASGATQGFAKTRLVSIGATYNNGPLSLGLAWDKHYAFYPGGNDEDGWVISAGYTFNNNLKLGGSYHKYNADPTSTTSNDITTYHIGIDWTIQGPHGLRAAWSHAGDIKGNGAMPRRPLVAGTALQGDSSADLWQIRYVHTLSKRTELTAGFSKMHNGSGANYEIGGSSTTQLVGQKPYAFAAAIRHNF
jgi:predicted porin